MTLMVFFNSKISPRTSTVIFLPRSPLATAVVTSAMFLTCAVKLPAMEFTDSVRSFHTPPTPFTSACPPSFPSVPTSRATRVTSPANAFNWSTITLMVFFNSKISPRTSTVILRLKSPFATAVVTSAMFLTCAVKFPAIEFTDSVKSFQTPPTPFTSDFAPHARHFARKRIQLGHHDVNGVLQLQNFAAHIHRNLAAQVAIRHRRRNFRNISHLRRQVPRHRVHGIRQILPNAADALHIRLTTQLAFRSDFPRYARNFRSKRRKLVHHRVNRVLQLQNFPARIHRNLSGQVALGHRGRHARDVAHLVGQVAGHVIHRIRQVLPSSRNVQHLGLSTQLAFRSDFLRHARNFRRERIELVHHHVHNPRRVQELALQRPPFHFQRHLLRQVALSHRADNARHLGSRLHQVRDQAINRLYASRITYLRDGSRTLRNSAFLTDSVADARELFRHLLVVLKNLVQRVVNFSADTGAVRRQAHGKVAILKRNQRVQQFRCIYTLSRRFSSHALDPFDKIPLLPGLDQSRFNL